MDFKKLFMNNKAVSPVIGVILMVAITVILAAAIGASVFGQGTPKSAPQANFNIQSAGLNDVTGGKAEFVKIEHLGGAPIHFEDATVTKVMVSLNGGQSYVVNTATDTANSKSLGTMSVGETKKFALVDSTDRNVFGTTVPALGNTISIKIIDVQTNQIICEKDIRV